MDSEKLAGEKCSAENITIIAHEESSADSTDAATRIKKLSYVSLRRWIANQLEPESDLRKLTDDDFSVYLSGSLILSTLGRWQAVFRYENADRGEWLPHGTSTSYLLGDLTHVNITIRKQPPWSDIPRIFIRIGWNQTVSVCGNDFDRLVAEAWALDNGWH